MLRDEALAIAVSVEVDGARRHNPSQIWPKPLEQCLPALVPVDAEQDLKRLTEVLIPGVGETEERRGRDGDWLRGPQSSKLRLIKVGLETGFEYIKGGG